MPQVLSREAATNMLDLVRLEMFTGAAVGNRFSLFQNDVVPTREFTTLSFIEADFSGYDGGGDYDFQFQAVFQQGKYARTKDAVPRVWTHDGGPVENTIYGYYVWLDQGSPGNSVLVWAERFVRPRLMKYQGDWISVQIQLSFTSEFSP